MKLTINGEASETSGERLTVAELVASRASHPVACAVEINKRLAMRRDWATTDLREGDQVEIVTLVGGG